MRQVCRDALEFLDIVETLVVPSEVHFEALCSVPDELHCKARQVARATQKSGASASLCVRRGARDEFRLHGLHGVCVLRGVPPVGLLSVVI
eukprot:scaffold131888_cov37-Tisochrysis_lutea.AAC.2